KSLTYKSITAAYRRGFQGSGNSFTNKSITTAYRRGSQARIAQEHKQDTSPLELPLDVEECVFNVEVQQNKATQLTDQEIALDANSDGSSGEPRHDYMMSSGAEDD
ncbi:hypothetical protein Tco_0885968, partial [Tanacetum coccineum]